LTFLGLFKSVTQKLLLMIPFTKTNVKSERDKDEGVVCVSRVCYPDARVWISRLAVEIPGGRDGISHV